MLIPLVVFIIALTITIKGADLFVDAAERIAKVIGVSDFVIGLTLVAVGTSIPELATGIISALSNATEIAAGTIIGSNIANIGLILGISSLITVMDFRKKTYHRDVFFLLCISILFYVFAIDFTISRREGVVFLAMLVIYVALLMKKRSTEEKGYERLLAYLYKPGKLYTLKTYEQAIRKGLNYATYKKLMKEGIDVKSAYRAKLISDITKQGLLAVFALVALFFGAKYLVSSTTQLALVLRIPKEIVAISAIAVGTSLPELSVSIAAAKKGISNILIGNIVGSCIANILLVGGISASIKALHISVFDLYFAIPVMIVLVIFFLRYLQVKWLTRVLEGITLLAIYALFLIVLIIFQLVQSAKIL